MSLNIRRARADDAAAFARVMADPAVFGALLQMPFPSEAMWRTRLLELDAANKADLLLVAELGGEVVGQAGLMPAGASPRRKHAMGLGIGVVAERQSQGVGSALMQALLDYADNWAQVLRIELNVYTDNERAIRLYRKFGFEAEGTSRAYALRGGVFVDVLQMARLHPNPPALR